MKRHSIARVSLVAAATLAAAVGLIPSGPVALVAAADPCSLCAGGEYHPVTPVRIFDSRHTDDTPGSAGINDVSPLGAKPLAPSRPTFDVQLLGALAGTPGSPLADLTTNDVLSVMISVTVVLPTHEGWLAAYPTGESPATLSSILNFSAGQTVPNLAIVRPGVGGKLTVQMFSPYNGSAHVLIDVQGWFSTSNYTAGTPDPADERGTRLIPVPPVRIMETRTNYGGTGPLGPSELRRLVIRGADGTSPVVADVVPDRSTIEGVLLNVTAVSPTTSTFVAVVPDDPLGRPATSNLNLLGGDVKANQVAVPLDALGEIPDGDIFLFNLAGQTELVVDVVGYFERITDDGVPETRQGRVIPLTSPFRVFDTREPSFGAVPLGPGQAEAWSFSNFAGSVNVDSVWVGDQLALIGNLTNASLARLYPTSPVTGFLTAFPADQSRPTASNINTKEGPPVPNMALVMYGTAAGKEYQATVYNHAGYTHYLLDVSAVVLAD
ncbi:MAG: hypothetical protein Q7V57_10435 [Actinomycetota bacterium]|nr:hypothetical protein [Actinomycetota bacterium]